MKIAIGSTNQIKVQAVEEVVREYPHFLKPEFVSIPVPSEISDQPLSLEEIIRGAKNRAKNAFEKLPLCQLSFGIESGLIKAEGTRTGYLETCICSIFNGRDFHIGLSCGFEVPPHVLDHVLSDGLTLNDACFRGGVTDNPKLGASEGLIGILTKGRINRKSYTKQSVMTALAQLEHSHWYA